MGLIERVRRYAAHEAMWSSRTRVVVAVSGGSDSVALLRVLRALQDQGDLHIASVAHLNHRIRPDAERDEAFCRALAERCALPYDAERVDVPALARDRRQSLEVAARIARRGFLERIRARRGAERIATGHTEDDQAETVLLRLIRGAGSRGLSGIAPRRGVWVRPLLCATRRELREHLRSAGETWCEDATNTDLAIPRNRVRHEVLPYLERHLNPVGGACDRPRGVDAAG
jgi:tRNA(Ile)-lysidine synthase